MHNPGPLCAVILPSVDFHDDHTVQVASSFEISTDHLIHSDKCIHNSKIKIHTFIAYLYTHTYTHTHTVTTHQHSHTHKSHAHTRNTYLHAHIHSHTHGTALR